MNIATISQLDDGTSGISVSGVVDYCKAAENKVGTYDGRDYNFWSQFIVLKDASGDIGVNLNLGDSKVNISKGQQIQIEKGTVASYQDKNGKTRKSLKAKLFSAGGQQAAPQAAQAPKAQQAAQSDPDNKNASYALSYAKDLAVAGKLVSMSSLEETADRFKYYLDNGKWESETHSITEEEPDDLPEGFGDEERAKELEEKLPF